MVATQKPPGALTSTAQSHSHHKFRTRTAPKPKPPRQKRFWSRGSQPRASGGPNAKQNLELYAHASFASSSSPPHASGDPHNHQPR
eukprot:5109518-Pyramimonas_sp.AAC.1